MHNWIFVATLAAVLTPVFIWSFNALPRERWQIICAIPIRKLPGGSWQGLNLTYYGLFNAAALSVSIALVFILTGAAGIDFRVFTGIIVMLMAICLPASSLIAGWVEQKPHTFSIGAASFLGIVSGPWLVLLMEIASRRLLSISVDTMAVVAALMVGYTLGEGIGRLGCISFGCCYGPPIEQMPAIARRYLSWAAFTYTGCTKKIAYAHHLEGHKVFAVQAVTAVLYSGCAMVGVMLYLNGCNAWAYTLCLVVTQGWRFASEFLRNDYRGDRRISVYQIMSLLTIPYGILIPLLFPAVGTGVDVMVGLAKMWDPAVILFLQVLGIIMFLRTGRSDVTGSGLWFHVKKDRI